MFFAGFRRLKTAHVLGFAAQGRSSARPARSLRQVLAGLLLRNIAQLISVVSQLLKQAVFLFQRVPAGSQPRVPIRPASALDNGSKSDACQFTKALRRRVPPQGTQVLALSPHPWNPVVIRRESSREEAHKSQRARESIVRKSRRSSSPPNPFDLCDPWLSEKSPCRSKKILSPRRHLKHRKSADGRVAEWLNVP